MELYFIRHGETEFNREKRYTGHSDIPLNATGVEQILALKKQLALKKITPDFIYTSDLERTVQTTALLGFDAPVHRAKELRELDYGKIEGMTYSEFKHRYPECERKWYDSWSTFPFPGGESYLVMCRRVTEFIDKHILTEKGETGFVVTHGGCLCAALSYYLTGDYIHFWRFRIGNGSFARLSVTEDYIYLNI